ncbi:hypothetical protein PCC7424_1541 [Gloeothece citriformis PCC 7424]|uniref:Sulfotransferase domain-containing protein n=1 Tax=Gloeothece citriformis (strain PCC 7424) TaxID=65393 RepID=B7K9L3_GLOC7|nr:sulfotransferase domain-containing protein [Gloeothece citriformis]ACK69981.1 hypothetical protein PCC7424_1541 [Gloeothece citriformis PCC 7424]
MTKLYLHIGTPKTGTTSIQHFLTVKREELLEQGFLYPVSGTINHEPGKLMNHDKLYAAIQHKLNLPVSNRIYKQAEWRQSLETEWNRFHSEIESHSRENVVISAESFSGLTIDGIKLIQENLSKYEVKIIVYIRKQDDLLQSLYNQLVKIGMYGHDVHKFIIDKKPSYIYYYDFIESWANLFGKDNIRVRVFEKQQFKKGLLEDFMEAIDLKTYNNYSKNISLVNDSPTTETTKLMMILNDLLLNKNQNLTSLSTEYRIRRRLNRRVTKLSLNKNSLSNKVFMGLLDIFIKDTQEVVLTQQERIDILKEFEETNQKVAREYLGRQDGRLFYKSQLSQLQPEEVKTI